MGKPLVLLDHEDNYGAEADAPGRPRVALYLLRRGGLDLPLEGGVGAYHKFPECRLPARHFRQDERPAAAPVPTGLAEARGLFYLGLALRKRPGGAGQWKQSISLLLLASDTFRRALEQEPQGPGAAGLWSSLLTVAGTCCLI